MGKIWGCLVLTAALGITAAIAQGSGSIHGRVADAEDIPFGGVVVVVKGAPLPQGVRASTDAAGRFRIDDLPAGTYTVSASYIGYETATMRNVSVVLGGVEMLDLVLSAIDLVQDRVVVSASRKEEKILTAPASVMVVSGGDLLDRPNLTVVSPLRHAPAVDYVQTGLTTTNVVTRGFNNVSSGALLSFVDNRISRVPSLRFNTHNFIPLMMDDIDRTELVLGPASALYGPNGGSGVMHIITRSPFDSDRTTLYSGGGERGFRVFSGRHARVLNDQIAFKISGSYYSGREWEYEDPEEVRLRGSNPRSYDIKRESVDFRLDLRPFPDGSLIFSAGHTKADNLEMTTLGTALARGWTYTYLQGRFQYKNLLPRLT